MANGSTYASSAGRAIPTGQMTLAEDGSVRAVFCLKEGSKEALVTAAQAVGDLDQGLFLRCAGLERRADSVSLSWPAYGARLLDLPSLVAVWRKHPAAHVLEALDVVREVCRAASALDHLRPSRFLLSPPQVFLRAEGANGERWAIAPLPVDGAEYAD